MIASIDCYRVEPIRSVLPVAPSTYHERVAQRLDPSRLSARAERVEAVKPEVMRVFAENFSVYGVRKVWRQMQRKGFAVARCTVQRLMRDLGLQDVIRGKTVRATISDKSAPCPLDLVAARSMPLHPTGSGFRNFPMRPLGPALFTWPRDKCGAFALYASTPMPAASFGQMHRETPMPVSSWTPLECALHDRWSSNVGGLIHHSDKVVRFNFAKALGRCLVIPSAWPGCSADQGARTIRGLQQTASVE